jgi:D-galactarolactone cycloisomerase
VIDDILAPFVLQREVKPNVLWEEMYSATRDFGQRGTYIDAISALNIAMWDVLGKHLGVPLCDLIGGSHRETVATYGTGCYYRGGDVLDVEASVKTAAEEAVKILA